MTSPTARAGDPERGRQMFLVVRYVLIIAVAAMTIAQQPTPLPTPTVLLILAALASNVVLGRIATGHFFHWAVQAPVLLGDTLWVSAVLLSAHLGQELFLFFFVLFLAAISESLGLLAVGAVFVGTASIVLAGQETTTSASLTRVPFFFAAAIFYGYIVDITKQEQRLAAQHAAWARRLEREVQTRTRELEQQSTQLRSIYNELLTANRLKSEFAANMSHELRSPLNVIIGYSDLLLAGEYGPLRADATEICSHIFHSATALHRLLENLLDFAQLEQQSITIRISEVSVPALVQQVLAVACQPHPVGLEFDVRVASQLPKIRTDAQKLSTILGQLVSNAIKFTPPGGRVSLEIEDLPGDGRVRFTVQDTGIGISPAHLKLIFEDFRQIDGTSTRAAGGVGLGLALVRRYLALLGGEISVTSEPGRGSTFGFTLPYGPNGDAPELLLHPEPQWISPVRNSRTRRDRTATTASRT